MFFDGTQNNRANTTDWQIWKDTGKHGDAPGKGSYENDYSNVAKLFDCYMDAQPGYDITIPKLYVEGIGTEDHKRDSIPSFSVLHPSRNVETGVALGTGHTGIPAKVDRGLAEMMTALKEKLGEPDPTRIIDCVHIDAFGFSRGAAAARHFVHKAIRAGATVAKQLAPYPVGEVKVRFVGLFDTVASYGVVHTNDTRDLDLDAISVADKVVHIAAAEEYRENFRLTNIKSKKGGIEIFLPGAHSDIGGGYADDSSEVAHELFYRVDYSGSSADGQTQVIDAIREARDADRNWMIKRGWYTKEELTQVSYHALIANRHRISNEYARIPLQMMAKYAGTGDLLFTDVLDLQYPVPPELVSVKATIEAAAATSSAVWLDGPDSIGPTIRHRYLHFSARYNGIGNNPEWSGQFRKRKIQDG